MAHVWYPPAASAAPPSTVNGAGTAIWPEPPEPQQVTAPSTERAQEWSQPAVSEAWLAWAPSGTPIWPLLFLPQHNVPLVEEERAQVW